MSYLLLILALVLLSFSVVGFIRNRTSLTNVVVLILGLMTAVVWAAVISGADQVLFVIAAIALLGGMMSLPILVCALLANGLVMIRRESRTLKNLLSFLVGVLIIVMVWSFVRIFSGDVNLFLGWGWLGAAMVAAYLSVGFVVYLIASWLYSAVPSKLKPKHVVVLGARLIDGEVPPLLRSRLDRSVQLLHDFEAKNHQIVLIPSGGQGPDESKPEGVGMAEYLVSVGVPADRILVEDRAVNTYQNLVFSRELAGDTQQPMGVVTNNYHVFRAALLARKIGLKAQVYGAKTKFYYLPSAVIREYAAILVQYKWLNALVIAVLLAVSALGLVGSLRN